MIGEWDVAMRLLLSFFVGGLVGYERQARHKSAGLRTHILVCLGACLIMVLSVNIYTGVEGKTNADPARLSAQVISGIGFLGAGTIMKEGATITGLTTAATLWIVSALGLAIGLGHFYSALICTGLVVFSLTLLPRIENIFQNKRGYNLIIDVEDQPGQIGKVETCLREIGICIYDMRVDGGRQGMSLVMGIDVPRVMKISLIIEALLGLEGVRSVRQG